MSKKKKSLKEPESDEFFLDTNIKKSFIRYRIYNLIILSIIFKITTIGITIFFARSTIDYFDLRNYALKTISIMNGNLPYVSFYHEYPILAIVPNILSSIPVFIFNNMRLLIPSYQFTMIIFDILTTICVYLIALKLYKERNAFIAGIIYTLSLVAAYTTLTRFDSFPVFLMMLSITFILYKDQNGYFINIIGFFTKIFPIIALPFLLIYESKVRNNLMLNIRNILITTTFLSLVLIGPFVVLVGLYNAIKPYIFATGSGLTKEYANTFTFMIYSWIHDVIKLSVNYSDVSFIIYIIMVISILGLLLLSYLLKEQDPYYLVMSIGLSLFSVIIFAKFHSPQYFMWVMPIFAILVADHIEKIIMFIIVQVFAYIEFPLMFGSFYTNVEYTNAIGSYGWYVALLFFTIEYIFIFLLIKMCSFDRLKETIKYYSHIYTNKVMV